jgi:hypothetical protein
MIKHQRVQMAPVAVRAPFCVRESFSAGRWKSEIPAMTRAHYPFISIVPDSFYIHPNLLHAFHWVDIFQR